MAKESNSNSFSILWADIEEEDQANSSTQIEQVVILIASRHLADNFINTFSTFQRLIRVATCLRFAHLCRNRIDSCGPLSVEELEYAKRCLFKTMEQFSVFQIEIDAEKQVDF